MNKELLGEVLSGEPYQALKSSWRSAELATYRDKGKRVYEPPSEDDGVRVLVDRLWPRGLSRESAKVDLWLRDAAPSDELRRGSAIIPLSGTSSRGGTSRS